MTEHFWTRIIYRSPLKSEKAVGVICMGKIHLRAGFQGFIVKMEENIIVFLN